MNTELEEKVTTLAALQSLLPWRRWAFAASAAFNILFFITLLHNPPITYAMPQPMAHAPPGWIIWAIRISFYSALALSTFADLSIAIGIFRNRYHLLLGLALGCSAFIAAFFGVIELIYSVTIGHGFTEPLTWLLLGALQTIITMSAYQIAPPVTLRPAIIAAALWQRFLIALRAFHQAWREVRP